MAGVGLDGYVVSRVPERLKQRLGAASYVLYGLRESLRFRPRPTSLVIDGESVSADLLWLLAANTRSYGGVIKIARDAVADDGLLDVYVFEGRGLRQTVSHGLRILRRRHDGGARRDLPEGGEDRDIVVCGAGVPGRRREPGVRAASHPRGAARAGGDAAGE